MNIIIIAEAGVNHNGKLKTALRLIDEAAKVGANYIKFQHTNPELISPSAPKAEYQKKNTKNNNTQKKMIEKLHLDWSKAYPILIKRCKIKKIKFLTSSFCIDDFKKIKKFKLDYIKIPSGEITNLPLLQEISKERKKILLSTGMANVKEIEQAIKILKKGDSNKKIVLMHCVSDYPTAFNNINLKTILYMKKKFKLEVGFSDHSLGIEAPKISVALGAKVIEKHFTLSKKMRGPDHKISLVPPEFKKMVNDIKKVEVILGKEEKILTKGEIKTKKLVRQSLHAFKTIKRGQKFSKNNCGLMRPNDGAPPKKYYNFIGKTAKKNYSKYDAIK